MRDALREAVQRAGSQGKLASLISPHLPKPTVQQMVWHHLNKTGRAPAEWVLPIEKETGVPRWKLRPDIYPPPADATPDDGLVRPTADGGHAVGGVPIQLEQPGAERVA